METCIFCKIAARQIPTKLLEDNDDFVVFNDIHPKAPIHLLVVPKQHIPSLNDLNPEHSDLIANLMLQLKNIANKHGLENGYRTVINTGAGGGQEIYHLHIHLTGGR